MQPTCTLVTFNPLHFLLFKPTYNAKFCFTQLHIIIRIFYKNKTFNETRMLYTVAIYSYVRSYSYNTHLIKLVRTCGRESAYPMSAQHLKKLANSFSSCLVRYGTTPQVAPSFTFPLILSCKVEGAIP